MYPTQQRDAFSCTRVTSDELASITCRGDNPKGFVQMLQPESRISARTWFIVLRTETAHMHSV